MIPFLTAGYPDEATVVETAVALAAEGAAALELGIPFSDPIADGPIIQEVSQRALARGVTVARALSQGAAIRERTELPIIAMTYANPILRYGPERFARAATEAGIDGVIITDVPPEELPSLWEPLRAAELATVLLVTPLTRPERLKTIVERASGFVYVVARTGVTGSGAPAAGLEELIRTLRTHTELPVAVGFGIESPEHARRFRGVADGVVVASALLRRMGTLSGAPAARVAAEFLRDLQTAAAGPA